MEKQLELPFCETCGEECEDMVGDMCEDCLLEFAGEEINEDTN